MAYAKIMGLGGYLPKKILTNHDLAKSVETTDEWIVQRTGIHCRHIAADDETTSDLAWHASMHALKNSGLSASDLDCIIVATASPDKIFPSTACLLQKKLMNTKAIAFDVSAACSGFVYAMTVADKFIKTGQARRVLVVGAEVLSRLVDWKDRSTCVLFGDGAGACILEAAEEPGIYETILCADGRYDELLYVNHCQTGNNASDPYIHMKGKELFRVAVGAVTDVILQTVKRSGISLQAVDWIIPHQANDRILDAISNALQYPVEKMVSTIGYQANTSAASIPLAFQSVVQEGIVRRGQTVLLTGFGAGMTWGTVLLKY